MMDTELKGVELPIFLIKEIFLEDNKILVKLSKDKILDYTFDDNKSAARVYKSIVEKMKRREKRITKQQ